MRSKYPQPLRSPSGEANFSGTGASGSTIDFNRDFDFGNEWGFEIKYAYRSENGKHKFVFDYANTDMCGARGITARTSEGQ